MNLRISIPTWIFTSHHTDDMPMLLRALLLASAHTVLVDAAAAPTKKRVMVWTTEDAANTK